MTSEPWDWKSECVGLIRAVDPHSHSRPLYILERDEADGLYDPRAFGALAAQAVVFSTRFRELLTRRGEWLGHGFVTVVDLAQLCGHSVLSAHGTILHEYVHDVLNRRVSKQFESGDLAEKPFAGVLTKLADPAEPIRPSSNTTFRKDLEHHGETFIRLALHVAYRARRRADWPGEPRLIVDPTQYGLSSIESYESLIGDEPERLAHVALTSVARSEPPAAFQLFAEVDAQRASAEFEIKSAAANGETADVRTDQRREDAHGETELENGTRNLATPAVV